MGLARSLLCVLVSETPSGNLAPEIGHVLLADSIAVPNSCFDQRAFGLPIGICHREINVPPPKPARITSPRVITAAHSICSPNEMVVLPGSKVRPPLGSTTGLGTA